MRPRCGRGIIFFSQPALCRTTCADVKFFPSRHNWPASKHVHNLIPLRRPAWGSSLDLLRKHQGPEKDIIGMMDLHKVSYPAFLPRPIFSLTPSPFHLLQWLTPATLSSRLVPPSSGTIPPTHRRRTMGLTKGTLVTATTTLTRHRLRPLTTAQMFNMPAIMGARRCHHRRQRPPQALHTPSPQPTLMGPTRRDTLATRQEPNRRDLTIHGNTPHHIRIRRRTNTRIHTPDLVLNLKGTTTIPPLMTRSLRRLATTNKSLYPLPCP